MGCDGGGFSLVEGGRGWGLTGYSWVGVGIVS